MMRKIVFGLSVFFGSYCLATTTFDTFAKYPNYVFVETGTYYGDGVSMALVAGFKEVYSLELSPTLYENCSKKFSILKNVHLFCGDSSKILYDVIKGINQPITFWLDGHYSGDNITVRGEQNTPLLHELDQIKKHPIKTHTIIIDDLRCCGTWLFDYITLQQIKDKLLEINPDYQFFYENGCTPGDVLVATPKKSG